MDMTKLGLSQGHISRISWPSPFKILNSKELFEHTLVHWGVWHTDTPFPPTCVYLHTTEYITALRLAGWRCWLFIYLGEGWLRYTEHSSAGDSLRTDKEEVLRHIKHWLSPGSSLSFFNLASCPVLFSTMRICMSLDSEGIFLQGVCLQTYGLNCQV